MTSPVSSYSNPCQVSAAQPRTQSPAAAAPKSKPPQDTVQLSPEAKAAAAAQDVDHDGDSH